MEDGSIKYQAADANFGPAIRAAREKAGLSQDAVAELMNDAGFSFAQSTIYKVEIGKRKVTIGEALALAQVLDVPVEKLALSQAGSDSAAREVIKAQARHCVQLVIEGTNSWMTQVRGNFTELYHLLVEYEDANPGEQYVIGRMSGSPADLFKPILALDESWSIEGHLRSARIDESTVDVLVALGIQPDHLYPMSEIEGPDEGLDG